MIFPQDKQKLYLPIPGPDVVVRGDLFPPDADHDDTWTLVRVNVPWTVVWHSPSGFGVGYGGSGPADLALNILQQFLPGQDVDCFKGTKCSKEAARLHHQFKEQFIAPMPPEGGVLQAATIREWIRRHGLLRDRLRWMVKMVGSTQPVDMIERTIDEWMHRFPEVRLSYDMDPDLDRLRHLVERFLIAAGHMARGIGDTPVAPKGPLEDARMVLQQLGLFLEELDRRSDELLMRKTPKGSG